jgi:hypothetical protein
MTQTSYTQRIFVNMDGVVATAASAMRDRDHGRCRIARILPTGDPVSIMAGAPLDLQRVLSSEICFKGQFLTRIEFPDPTPEQIARIFMRKLAEKCLVPRKEERGIPGGTHYIQHGPRLASRAE